MISAAFHYRGRSNVIIGEKLHLIVKLQRNSNVDRIQVVSPECISIKYTIEDCPGP